MNINEIKIPEGHEIDWDKSKIKFKPIKSILKWEDIPTLTGAFVGADSEVEIVKDRKLSPENDKNIAPNQRYCEAWLALCQLLQLALQPEFDGDVIQKWARWDDINQPKFCISFKMGENLPYIYESHGTEFTLCLSTKEKAEKFIDDYKDLIKKARLLL